MRSQLRSVHESDEVPVSQSGCENSRIIPHVALLELCPEVCLAFYVFSRGSVVHVGDAKFKRHQLSPGVVRKEGSDVRRCCSALWAEKDPVFKSPAIIETDQSQFSKYSPDNVFPKPYQVF